MKSLTILVVLIAVTGVNLVFRNSLYSPAEASRGPEPAARRDHAAGVDRPAPPDLPAGKTQEAAAELTREADRDGDVVLARIAAECGNHLFAKARRLPDNPHLLNQAAQHYRACLAHEPTCPDAGALFRDARARLDQVERLLAGRNSPPAGGAVRKTPAVPQGISPPTEKPAARNKPVEEARTPAENPAVEKDDVKMVGPDGVIYQRSSKK